MNAAAAVLEELGVTDVAVIGLAKRLEEVWVPRSRADPVIMPRNSDGLYLLQRVRDEAHRFAITYHRSKRSKRMTASALDSVRGLGEHRRKALVTHFGSVARLKDASVEEITAVPGIGVATANAVLEALGVPTIKDEVSMTGQGMTRARSWRRIAHDRRARPAATISLRPGSTSSSSPGCRERAVAPRPRSSKTSAGTSPTTCRRS